MESLLPSKKIGKILFMTDPRLSRERFQSNVRLISLLRQVFEVEMFSANGTEEEAFKKVIEGNFSLVLLPWYRYSEWLKLDSFYNFSKGTGPTVAGYFGMPLTPQELSRAVMPQGRLILLDFTRLANREIIHTLACLCREKNRSGLIPWVGDNAPIYYDEWRIGDSLGARIDAVSSLSELQFQGYRARINEFRTVLSALWSLVYDEGPARAEMNSGENIATRGRKIKAHFYVSFSAKIGLTFRLVYAMNQWTPQNIIESFSPDTDHSNSPYQILLRFGDILRVHKLIDRPEVEIIVSQTPSSPSHRHHLETHSLWIQPIHSKIFNEDPKSLLQDAMRNWKSLVPPGGSDDVTPQISGFLQRIHELEDEVHALKSGGVGQTQKKIA